MYIVSDSTGITAERFSHSVLSQFENVQFESIHLPYVDTLDKAQEVVSHINLTAYKTGLPPIVFSTLVSQEILALVRRANGIFLDLFSTFLRHIEQSLGLKSSHSIGRSHMVVDTARYTRRIDAINFSLAHDDGQFSYHLDQADVILLGVSRCGKTPTSLYLAMQYAVKAANFPLTPDDFIRGTLPRCVMCHRKKLFGLSIQAERLAEIRHERRPNSKYASLTDCYYEVVQSERMMRENNISWLYTTAKSIEEIATTVLQAMDLSRSAY